MQQIFFFLGGMIANLKVIIETQMDSITLSKIESEMIDEMSKCLHGNELDEECETCVELHQSLKTYFMEPRFKAYKNVRQ